MHTVFSIATSFEKVVANYWLVDPKVLVLMPLAGLFNPKAPENCDPSMDTVKSGEFR